LPQRTGSTVPFLVIWPEAFTRNTPPLVELAELLELELLEDELEELEELLLEDEELEELLLEELELDEDELLELEELPLIEPA
jgi:hypothetical protein